VRTHIENFRRRGIAGELCTGYNAAHKSILFLVNFDELINDFIPGPQKNFYEKEMMNYATLAFPSFNKNTSKPSQKACTISIY
jgi:hypothetical protein